MLKRNKTLRRIKTDPAHRRVLHNAPKNIKKPYYVSFPDAAKSRSRRSMRETTRRKQTQFPD